MSNLKVTNCILLKYRIFTNMRIAPNTKKVQIIQSITMGLTREQSVSCI